MQIRAAIASCAIACSGCAPILTYGPPPPLPSVRGGAVGIGADFIPSQHGASAIVGGYVFAQGLLDEHLDIVPVAYYSKDRRARICIPIGEVISCDRVNPWGFGAMVRYWTSHGKFDFGPFFGVGFVYAQVGFNVAFNARDWLSVYVSPRIGAPLDMASGLPVGVWIHDKTHIGLDIHGLATTANPRSGRVLWGVGGGITARW
jgi:hypothetical protein